MYSADLNDPVLFEKLNEIIYVKVVQDSVNVKFLPFFSIPFRMPFSFPFSHPLLIDIITFQIIILHINKIEK